VFGGNSNGAVTYLGGSGNDTLAGTAVAETFVGALGDDTLTGGGGADAFQGGAGDDLIEVSDMTFRRADGGAGEDTLALSGAGQELDLANFANQILGIEVIDLTGSGGNSLTVTAERLLALSDTSNRLIVKGNANDFVFSGDFVTDGTREVDGVIYSAYVEGQALLLLAPDITFNPN